VNARRPGRGHEWSPCAEQPLPACAFLAVAALTAAVACTGDRTPSAVVRSGGLTFEASLDPERARLKDNNVEVRLLDDDGSPIEGAQIDAVALMPAMGAMPEMRSRAEVAEVGNGRYRAELDVAMAGTWVLTVDARMPGGGGGTAKYSFTVGKPGLVSLDGGAAERQVPSSDHGEHAVVSPRGEAGGSGVVRIDPRRWQTIGVRTGVVERRPLRLEIRAVGKVVYDETRLSEISVKYAGWIGELEVDTTGQAVRRGQTLFTLYSPELYAAQQELLTAVASQHSARATSAPDRADYLVEASRQRLRLWDLDDAQIDRIVASGEPTQYLPIRSTATGVVIEKRVVAGAAVQPGMPLYRIAGLDRVWVEAEVYESDLALVEVGQEAEIVLPYLPGRRFAGRVAFVYPYLEGASRTGRVRVELPNREDELKPDMYAEVLLEVDRGTRLMVPASAVLSAGARRLVFRSLGEGRLEPVEVVVGASAENFVEVLDGLAEGDVVVTSGTFLVAAESRLGAAEELWR
jgi:membrane fusion protein, copper/silver efflux system